MIYLIFSQVVMFLMNFAILINSKLNIEFYKLYYMSIPVIFYCVFMFLFYIRRLKECFSENRYSSGVDRLIPAVAALIMNIVYFVIEIFIDNPDNPFLFYISTTIIQLINVLFIFSYQKKIAEVCMTTKQELLNKVMSYTYVMLAVLTLYTCVFVNIYITIVILLITSLVLTLSLSVLSVARRKFRSYKVEDAEE